MLVKRKTIIGNSTRVHSNCEFPAAGTIGFIMIKISIFVISEISEKVANQLCGMLLTCCNAS